MLLTAAPMQVHPVKVWGLLHLLGPPARMDCGRLPHRVSRSPGLMPPGTDVRLLAPAMGECLRVTTDPAWYEEHPESVRLWAPGNPLFQAPEFVVVSEALPEKKKALIDFFSR